MGLFCFLYLPRPIANYCLLTKPFLNPYACQSWMPSHPGRRITVKNLGELFKTA